MIRAKKPKTALPTVVSIGDPGAIGQRIKIIRGTTDQIEFAKHIGVSKNSVGRYERDESPPDVKFLQRLCLAYPTINPGWLLMGSGPQLLSDLTTDAALNEKAFLTAMVWVENQTESAGIKIDAVKKGQMLIDVYQTLLTAPSRVNPRFVLGMFKAHTE